MRSSVTGSNKRIAASVAYVFTIHSNRKQFRIRQFLGSSELRKQCSVILCNYQSTRLIEEHKRRSFHYTSYNTIHNRIDSSFRPPNNLSRRSPRRHSRSFHPNYISICTDECRNHQWHRRDDYLARRHSGLGNKKRAWGNVDPQFLIGFLLCSRDRTRICEYEENHQHNDYELHSSADTVSIHVFFSFFFSGWAGIPKMCLTLFSASSFAQRVFLLSTELPNVSAFWFVFLPFMFASAFLNLPGSSSFPSETILKQNFNYR